MLSKDLAFDWTVISEHLQGRSRGHIIPFFGVATEVLEKTWLVKENNQLRKAIQVYRPAQAT